MTPSQEKRKTQMKLPPPHGTWKTGKTFLWETGGGVGPQVLDVKPVVSSAQSTSSQEKAMLIYSTAEFSLP